MLAATFGYGPYYLYAQSGFARYLQLRRELAVTVVRNAKLRAENERLFREAESLRQLFTLPAEAWPQRLKTQPLTLMGSRLALWRWGQFRVREGRLGPEPRRLWEDRLLASGTSELLFEYALRHARSQPREIAEGDSNDRAPELSGGKYRGFPPLSENAR